MPASLSDVCHGHEGAGGSTPGPLSPGPTETTEGRPHLRPGPLHSPGSSPGKGPCWGPPGAMKLRGKWGVPLTYSCGKGPPAAV